MRTGKSWSSTSRREQHRSGKELWIQLYQVPTISRSTECLWTRRNTWWRPDPSLSYFGTGRTTPIVRRRLTSNSLGGSKEAFRNDERKDAVTKALAIPKESPSPALDDKYRLVVDAVGLTSLLQILVL